MKNKPDTETPATVEEGDCLVVRLYSGMVLVGELLGSNENNDLFLKNPLMYQYGVQNNRVIVQFDLPVSPGCKNAERLMATLRIREPQIMWVDEANDNLKASYKQTLDKNRAAKSGIVLANPNDVPKLGSH